MKTESTLKTRYVLAAFVLTALTVGAFAASRSTQAPASAASPAQQIRTVMDKQVVAWNNHDLEGFMSSYWNSPELTFYSGPDKFAGWQTAIDRYRKRYQGEGKEMGHLDFTDLQIESLGPDSAFVTGHWHLKFTIGEAGGLFTLIFRHYPDGWKIIHDHTS